MISLLRDFYYPASGGALPERASGAPRVPEGTMLCCAYIRSPDNQASAAWTASDSVLLADWLIILAY